MLGHGASHERRGAALILVFVPLVIWCLFVLAATSESFISSPFEKPLWRGSPFAVLQSSCALASASKCKRVSLSRTLLAPIHATLNCTTWKFPVKKVWNSFGNSFGNSFRNAGSCGFDVCVCVTNQNLSFQILSIIPDVGGTCSFQAGFSFKNFQEVKVLVDIFPESESDFLTQIKSPGRFFSRVISHWISLCLALFARTLCNFAIWTVEAFWLFARIPDRLTKCCSCTYPKDGCCCCWGHSWSLRIIADYLER